MLPPSCLKDSVLGMYACLDHLATLVREIKVNYRFAQLACTGYYMTRFFRSLDALIQETHFAPQHKQSHSPVHLNLLDTINTNWRTSFFFDQFKVFLGVLTAIEATTFSIVYQTLSACKSQNLQMKTVN